MNRYLDETDEKVFSIYEQDLNSTRYIGRVLISKYGAMIFKEDMRIFLTWEEIDLINQKREE